MKKIFLILGIMVWVALSVAAQEVTIPEPESRAAIAVTYDASQTYGTTKGVVLEVKDYTFIVCNKECYEYPLEVFYLNNDYELPRRRDIVTIYDCLDRTRDDCGIYELGFNSVPAVKKD